MEKDGVGRLAFHENGFPEVINQSISPPPAPPLKNQNGHKLLSATLLEARGGRPSVHMFKLTANADGDKLPSFLDRIYLESIYREKSLDLYQIDGGSKQGMADLNR